jgi:hypothetical protein
MNNNFYAMIIFTFQNVGYYMNWPIVTIENDPIFRIFQKRKGRTNKKK